MAPPAFVSVQHLAAAEAGEDPCLAAGGRGGGGKGPPRQ